MVNTQLPQNRNYSNSQIFNLYPEHIVSVVEVAWEIYQEAAEAAEEASAQWEELQAAAESTEEAREEEASESAWEVWQQRQQAEDAAWELYEAVVKAELEEQIVELDIEYILQPTDEDVVTVAGEDETRSSSPSSLAVTNLNKGNF